MVRVQDKEYGPVSLELLHEWRSEGRLIPENEVRRADEESWTPAREFDELFPRARPAAVEVPATTVPRSFGGLLAATLGAYFRGCLRLFCISLLVAVPSLILQLALVHLPAANPAAPAPGDLVAAMSVFAMLGVLIFTWPVSLAALSLASAELLRRGSFRLGPILRQALGLWPRFAKLCLFVYATYFCAYTVPAAAIMLVITPEVTIASFVWALLILFILVYIVARLFINFLFWQQVAALGDLGGLDALNESKRLARSRPEAPRLQRPFYRGAIVASGWLILLLTVGAITELPFLFSHLHEMADPAAAFALFSEIANPKALDATLIANYATSTLIHALLRPLLTVAFVALYFDAQR